MLVFQNEQIGTILFPPTNAQSQKGCMKDDNINENSKRLALQITSMDGPTTQYYNIAQFDSS